MDTKKLEHRDLLRKFKMGDVFEEKAKYNKYSSRLLLYRFHGYQKVKL